MDRKWRTKTLRRLAPTMPNLSNVALLSTIPQRGIVNKGPLNFNLYLLVHLFAVFNSSASVCSKTRASGMTGTADDTEALTRTIFCCCLEFASVMSPTPKPITMQNISHLLQLGSSTHSNHLWYLKTVNDTLPNVNIDCWHNCWCFWNWQ